MSDDGTQHPLKIYWIMWVALFVLSSLSYATDFMDRGALRTFLILLFMFIKAAGITWIFMVLSRWRHRSSQKRLLRGLVTTSCLAGSIRENSTRFRKARRYISRCSWWPASTDTSRSHDASAMRILGPIDSRNLRRST